MQSYFLIFTRRSDGYRHVSPISFPYEEVNRRVKKIPLSTKLTWKVSYVEAPESHQRWFEEMDNVWLFPLGDFEQIIKTGARQLVANQYYGLLQGAPNEEEFCNG